MTATETTPEQPDEQSGPDPFLPFDDNRPASGPILTFRALLVGILCGTLVNTSNIYLGLKAGWTSSANIFGSVIGFAVLRKWSKSSSSRQEFGPHENNIVQTAATAAGGLSNVFVSAVPALYQLGLMDTPTKDYFRIVILTAIGGCFGLLSVAPLRKFFLIHVARELDLVFPSSSATAMTIRSMHQAIEGAAMAQRKLRAMVIAFSSALLLRVVSQYAIGVFWDWHVFTWLINSGVLVNVATSMESWGWFIEWTPAFIGSGMLVNVNVAVSFLSGSVLAWGMIGPYLVTQGLAFGEHRSTDPKWSELMSYSSLSSEFANADHPSPRYWLLWPGVICMMATSLTELACQWRLIWTLLRDFTRTLLQWVAQMLPERSNYRYTILSEPGSSDTLSDKDEGIKTWMWLPGLLFVVAVSCPILKVEYGMPIAETLLALFLAFVLSLLAIQATGATDTVPLGTLSKVSQVIVAGVSNQPTIEASQRLNLLGGALTNIGGSQACDLMGDFRVGYLLGTPSLPQYTAQLIGTSLAALISPGIFVLFATAYPCILTTESTAAAQCEFSSPSVSAWRTVAVAMTEPSLPIPPSSLTFAIAMSLLGIMAVLTRHFLWRGKWAHMRAYHPNMMILAMAFTLPATHYGIAFLMGAVAAVVWRRCAPAGFEAFGYAVAAGFIAGEGIGGSVNAAMSILGIGGRSFGSGVGCPAGVC
ncbi:OPT superfamily oligopeptide transporter [Aspergillus steynii IBT 23096]|uniref:OPT superfamily oligopeptide transporter n=1 Tax=Aspergillus steynii IBT 23096 TaxID=1392250 RepID=A0A2I2GKG2_9EURO|nr:OPT superfamily oligopeptide transporter [Aspergillus steynii IBT 23096]PLB53361.1 OPT superfamily oligopeptide transporter [Aspergillus steynii IBT 23096]